MTPKTQQSESTPRCRPDLPSDEEWFAAEAKSPDDLETDPEKEAPQSGASI